MNKIALFERFTWIRNLGYYKIKLFTPKIVIRCWNQYFDLLIIILNQLINTGQPKNVRKFWRFGPFVTKFEFKIEFSHVNIPQNFNLLLTILNHNFKSFPNIVIFKLYSYHQKMVSKVSSCHILNHKIRFSHKTEY